MNSITNVRTLNRVSQSLDTKFEWWDLHGLGPRRSLTTFRTGQAYVALSPIGTDALHCGPTLLRASFHHVKRDPLSNMCKQTRCGPRPVMLYLKYLEPNEPLLDLCFHGFAALAGSVFAHEA